MVKLAVEIDALIENILTHSCQFYSLKYVGGDITKLRQLDVRKVLLLQ